METLQEVFLHELQDMLHAEKQLVKALPKMAKAATNNKLRTALKEHLEQTKGQVRRLERVFKTLDEKPKAKTCKGMKGLVEEGSNLISKEDEGEALDVSLICAAQKVEHYEMAAYGSLCTWAKELDNEEALELLKENMSEEEEADKKLTEIAKSDVNPAALNGAHAGREALM